MRNAATQSHHSLLSIRRKLARIALDCPSVASPLACDLCSRNPLPTRPKFQVPLPQTAGTQPAQRLSPVFFMHASHQPTSFFFLGFTAIASKIRPCSPLGS